MIYFIYFYIGIMVLLSHAVCLIAEESKGGSVIYCVCLVCDVLTIYFLHTIVK